MTFLVKSAIILSGTVNAMSDLAHGTKIPSEYEIKTAEKVLVSKLDEAAKCKDSDCVDYKVFSKHLRDRIVNGNL